MNHMEFYLVLLLLGCSNAGSTDKPIKRLITPTDAYKECVEQFVMGDCTDLTEKECYLKAYIEGAACVLVKQEEK